MAYQDPRIALEIDLNLARQMGDKAKVQELLKKLAELRGGAPLSMPSPITSGRKP